MTTPQNIVGIGVDLCSISRIQQTLKQHGQRFITRLCTASEMTDDAVQLTKLWAAKEAVSKALGTGIGAQLSFQDIIITKQETGQPQVTLVNHNAAIHLSYSREGDTIIAFAIALSNPIQIS